MDITPTFVQCPRSVTRLAVTFLTLVCVQAEGCWLERGDSDRSQALHSVLPAAADLDSGSGCDPHAYEPCLADPHACNEADPNALCASYTSDPANSFCAPFCRTDGECPVVEGFGVVCNFAWCAVLCEDGRCPDGMVCVPSAVVLDWEGRPRTDSDVCVPRA